MCESEMHRPLQEARGLCGGAQEHFVAQQEFFCNACQQVFLKTLTEEESAEGAVLCPYCESEDVDHREAA